MDPVTSNWRYFNTSTTSSGGLEADLRNDASIASKVQQFQQRRGRTAVRADDSQSSSQVCPHCNGQQCCRRHRWQWHAASAPPGGAPTSQGHGNAVGIQTATTTSTSAPTPAPSSGILHHTPPASVLPSQRLSSEVWSYFDGCCFCC